MGPRSSTSAGRAPRTLTRLDALDDLLPTDSPWLADRHACAAVTARFPMRVPHSYLRAADFADPFDPLLRMALPAPAELREDPYLLRDPLAEEQRSPIPRLVHRYPDRVLLLVTEACAVYCRFCTRKRLVGASTTGRPGAITDAELRSVVDYITAHPEIREVVISGGDPLVLGDSRLAAILRALRRIPSVDVLRLHTRIPVVAPRRVTKALAALLARHGPLFVMIHAAHPHELTPDVARALSRLADAGLPLGAQTVLLRGINDDEATLRALFTGLLRLRVRPYYLHQCDLTAGTAHFRTPLARGPLLLRALRGTVSGTALPTFVVDLAGGHGKLQVVPEMLVPRRDDAGRTWYRLTSPFGIAVDYPEVPGD